MHAIDLDVTSYRPRLAAELEKQRHVLADCNTMIDELARATDQESLDARASTCRQQTRVLAAIDAIEHALARLDNGTYGQCERCDHPIGDARLDALPTTSLCIGCAMQ